MISWLTAITPIPPCACSASSGVSSCSWGVSRFSILGLLSSAMQVVSFADAIRRQGRLNAPGRASGKHFGAAGEEAPGPLTPAPAGASVPTGLVHLAREVDILERHPALTL